ncbi:hypothetical protein ACF0H5_013962 [Mactra antiquata]
MDQKTNGCFAWFKNMKESLTRRWTKFRSKHKRDILDTRYNTTYLHHLLTRTNEKTLLDQFINEILNNAKTDLESQIMNMESTLDRLSMSSSIISQIADALVTDSLTSIANDINQSADVCRQKTISEFMNTFGIANETHDDGMPAVSD